MKNRREFIGCGTCALLLVGCGDKNISSTNDSASLDTDAPAPEELEPSFDPCATTAQAGWTELNLEDYPALVDVGGYIKWNSMIIAHVEEGCYAAVAASCTHQGGEIYYSHQRKQFSCLEHAATFDLDGSWSLGTVTNNLESYLVAKQGDTLFVETQ